MTRVHRVTVTCGACGGATPQEVVTSVFLHDQVDLEGYSRAAGLGLGRCTHCQVVTTDLTTATPQLLSSQRTLTSSWAMSDEELWARSLIREGKLLEGLQRLVWSASSRQGAEARALRLEAASVGFAALISLGTGVSSDPDDTQESPAVWSFLAEAARRAGDQDLCLRIVRVLRAVITDAVAIMHLDTIERLASAGQVERAFPPEREPRR
jgi:hypothetical protein